MTTPPPTTNRNPPRVDWDAARAFYVALGQGTRTFAVVSKKFSVSELTVRKWARRQDWVAVAAEADARAAEKALASAERTLEQRNRDTVRVADKVRETVLADGVSLDPNVALRVLPRLSTLEQLIAGGATGRVEISEVTSVISAFYVVTGRFVPVDVRAEWMAELDAALGGLLELGSGEAAA